jgi:hypothetical protein
MKRLNFSAFAVSAVLTISSATTNQVIQAQMKNVKLISDTDIAFSASISKPALDLYNKISDPNNRHSIVLLSNNDDRKIAGYVVKWTVTTNGQSKSFFQAFDESELIDRPDGPVQGYGLASRDSRLIAPIFNVHLSELSDPGMANRFNALNLKHPIARAISAGAPALAQLDAVVFADGSFEGNDESDYFDRFMAERNGKHDAAVSVLLASSKGETETQIVERLNKAISDGQTATQTTPETYYKAARAKWSRTLLDVRQQMGRQAMLRNATAFAALKPIHLKKS